MINAYSYGEENELTTSTGEGEVKISCNVTSLSLTTTVGIYTALGVVGYSGCRSAGD